jgi:hypothetical protein
MDFNQFIQTGKVMKGEKDPQKCKALVSMSSNNLEIVKDINLSEKSASIILSSSYESLRQVLEAIALLEGYKVFSHEAFAAYLKTLNEESTSEKFDRLRKLRNGVNYYGKSISVDVARQALIDAEDMIEYLVKKYIY